MKGFARFEEWMNNKFSPALNKIVGNIWVSSITDAFILSLPLILVNSLATIVSIIPGVPDLSMINNFSFGLFGIIVAFLIPYYIMEKKGIERFKLITGLTSMAVYLMLSHPTINPNTEIAQWDFSRFGSAGLFVSIVVGLIVARLMSWFLKDPFFSRNTVIPPFVSAWFDSLLPITIVLVIGWIITYLLKWDVFTVITKLVTPLLTSAQSFTGFIVFFFLTVFLYSFGVSTWWNTSIWYGFALPAMAANIAMAAKGLPATNINTLEVAGGWVLIGGTGCTLPLVVMMLFSKSRTLKMVARAAIAPGILNINEPIVFGAPIAWNPILMIPMWINGGLLVPIITYLTLYSGLVTIPHKSFLLWFVPVGIQTYLVNDDWRGLVLLAVLIALTTVIWYPFYKVHERHMMERESAATTE